MTHRHDDRDTATLAARLALMDSCRQAEGRATTSQVASVIAHMIGTPLNVIVGRAALLRANPTPEGIEDNVRRIEEQAQRLTLRIHRLIDYLDVPDPDGEQRPARDVLLDAGALYAPIAQHHGKKLEVSRSDSLGAVVHGARTLAILTALLSMAVRTASAGAAIRLSAAESEGPAGAVFTVWVPGMEPVKERIDRLEPPEHVTPEHLERTQMLARCAATATRNGGRLEVLSDEAGAGVTLKLFCESGADA